MLIDAHCHVWSIGQNDHAWPTPDLAAIHRDFGLDDLAAVGAPCGLDGAILVQSQPSLLDTFWLLRSAAESPLALGVVGWVDLAGRDAPTQIRSLSTDPLLRGLRPMLQNIPDAAWILDRRLDRAIVAMIDANLTFDALVQPRHLPHLLTFVRRWPELRVVIDHGAKPDIAAGALDPWRDQIAALAAEPSAFCKLSGLLTEAGDHPTAEALAPFVEHLLSAFGPQRLMWGSDWPVVTLAAGYADWRAMAADLVAALSSKDRAELFGRTARRFYGV